MLTIYFNAIRNAKLRIYINPWSIFASLFILVLLLEGFENIANYGLTIFFHAIPFPIIIYFVISILFYPFVKLWLSNTTFIQKYMPQRSLKNHIRFIWAQIRHVDASTPDDIEVRSRVHYNSYNQTYTQSNISERRSRDTAYDNKEQFVGNYFFIYLAKFCIFTIVASLSPFLGWFIIPILNKNNQIQLLWKKPN